MQLSDTREYIFFRRVLFTDLRSYLPRMNLRAKTNTKKTAKISHAVNLLFWSASHYSWLQSYARLLSISMLALWQIAFVLEILPGHLFQLPRQARCVPSVSGYLNLAQVHKSTPFPLETHTGTLVWIPPTTLDG